MIYWGKQQKKGGAAVRERITLGLFLLILTLCLVLRLSVLIALFAGWALFMLYGIRTGRSIKSLLQMSLQGISRIKTILITFVLIGMLTGVWRLSGTIPYIAARSIRAITPGLFYLMTFLLCSFISTLMGTSFGSAATMGLICMTVCVSLGLDPALTGGALLSGVYVGDRWSPMSTSALLVSTLTDTDIYRNIRGMVKTAWLPFIVSCALYALPGLHAKPAPAFSLHVADLFEQAFVLHPSAFVPALSIIVLSLLKVKVRLSMLVSIAFAILVSTFLQHQAPDAILKAMVLGYESGDPQLARMLNGGGIVSMLRTAGIVSLSATYSGLFEGTGLLSGLRTLITRLGKKTTPYFGVLTASVFYALIGFNQTLPVMLTHQLCKGLMDDREKLALAIENTAILIPALVPWSIAGSVPLLTAGAGLGGIPFAFFLYLVPLWNLVKETKNK